MPREIEHRYVVDISLWQRPVRCETIWQAYLSLDPRRVVRVRLVAEVGILFDHAYLTIKGKKIKAACPEFEYPIPVSHGKEQLMMRLSDIVKKTRYIQEFGGNTWYVDVFHDKNHGLVLAEIEIPEEGKSFELPPWVGEEVTEDSKYSNVMLSQHPYGEWSDDNSVHNTLFRRGHHAIKKLLKRTGF